MWEGGREGGREGGKEGVPELLEGELTLALGNVTMEHAGVLGGVGGGGRQLVGLRFGLCEDHRTPPAGVSGNDVLEHVLAGRVGVRDLDSDVTDGGGGTVAPADGIDVDGILEVFAGDVLHPRRGGGREQEHLCLGHIEVGEDLLNVLSEAHLEHLVRLVQDDVPEREGGREGGVGE